MIERREFLKEINLLAGVTGGGTFNSITCASCNRFLGIFLQNTIVQMEIANFGGRKEASQEDKFP